MRRSVFGFCGDLMLGRGVDRFLKNHSPEKIWSDVLPYLQECDCLVGNLETTLTTSPHKIPKVFNFQSHPHHVEALKIAGFDVVNLANNHILDFSEEGLLETIKVLDGTQIQHVGAGRNIEEAKKEAIITKQDLKIAVIGCSDNEPLWKATNVYPGIYWIDTNQEPADLIKQVHNLKKSVDLIILSIHWGPNMRERPGQEFIDFAHKLIEAGVDIIHGHSAHIFQGIERYQNGLIFYDTGDFVDDYAIDPTLRNDLSFFFQVEVKEKKIFSLQLFPIRIENYCVHLAKGEGFVWAVKKMQELSKEFDVFFTANDCLYYQL